MTDKAISLAKQASFIYEPRKLPVVLSSEEVAWSALPSIAAVPLRCAN
jgi:hypothetical protein